MVQRLGWIGRWRARAAIMILLALPGSTYIYQGDELGLHEVADLPREVLEDPMAGRSMKQKGRDGCRVPLPWTPDGLSHAAGLVRQLRDQRPGG
jgi:alpha-glucosidase